jgi:hypothetical protein
MTTLRAYVKEVNVAAVRLGFNIFQFFSNLASSPTIHCLPSTVAKNNLPNQYGVCMCRRRWTVTNSTKDVRKQFIQRGDDDGVDSLRENRLFFES